MTMKGTGFTESASDRAGEPWENDLAAIVASTAVFSFEGDFSFLVA